MERFFALKMKISLRIYPVVLRRIRCNSGNGAGLDAIRDSDELKSLVVFRPYLCQFSWQMVQRHES